MGCLALFVTLLTVLTCGTRDGDDDDAITTTARPRRAAPWRWTSRCTSSTCPVANEYTTVNWSLSDMDNELRLTVLEDQTYFIYSRLE